jgi:hypothetical protein
MEYLIAKESSPPPGGLLTPGIGPQIKKREAIVP